MYLEVLVLFREIKTSKVKLQTKKGIGSCWLHSSLIVCIFSATDSAISTRTEETGACGVR